MSDSIRQFFQFVLNIVVRVHEDNFPLSNILCQLKLNWLVKFGNCFFENLLKLKQDVFGKERYSRKLSVETPISCKIC